MNFKDEFKQIWHKLDELESTMYEAEEDGLLSDDMIAFRHHVVAFINSTETTVSPWKEWLHG